MMDTGSLVDFSFIMAVFLTGTAFPAQLPFVLLLGSFLWL